MYGDETRYGIIKWQLSQHRPLTGLLDDASAELILPSSQVAAADALARVVIDCFKSGYRTVQSMYSCSGKWVTPRALLYCSLQTGCPVIDGTAAGREIALASLGAAKLDTVLTLDPQNLPPFPTQLQLMGCKTAPASEAFRDCVLSEMSKGAPDLLMRCGKGADPQNSASCLVNLTGNTQIISIVECMAGKPRTVDNFVACSNTPDLIAQVDIAEDCVAKGKGGMANCLLPKASTGEAKFLSCVSGTGGDASQAAECLGHLDPTAVQAIHDIKCVTEASTDDAATDCLAQHLGNEAPQVAACIAARGDKAVTCLAGIPPEYRAAQQAYSCIENGRDASSFVENCAGSFIKDDKTREAVSCVARAGTDRDQLAACAAQSVLPPNLARYAACVGTSQGPTDFAICAAGPQMNEEWRIAAECAVETGGNPVGFAGCAAGRLTVREITKCFSGQIGKDCFGKNNTVVNYFEDEFHDLTQGPGRDNEIVKAVTAIIQVSGGPNSVVNNPGQILGGPNYLFHNPDQILGGPNSVARQIANRLPKLPNLPTKLPNLPLPKF